MKLVTDDGTEIEIEDLRVVDLQLGDVVVFRLHDDNPSYYHLENAHQHVKAVFPDNEVMVISKNDDIEIVRIVTRRKS